MYRNDVWASVSHIKNLYVVRGAPFLFNEFRTQSEGKLEAHKNETKRYLFTLCEALFNGYLKYKTYRYTKEICIFVRSESFHNEARPCILCLLIVFLSYAICRGSMLGSMF